jgi:hypothetical protein
MVLLLGRLIAECGGDRQPDCSDDCEEPDANRSGKTSGADHKQGARVAYFRLVQERVAFDNNKCDNRGPEAEAQEPAAHATRR